MPPPVFLGLMFLAAGHAGAAPASDPPAPARAATSSPAPRLAWSSPIDRLPAAADPAAIGWRASNQTVYRLNGHIGHWRGALQLPAIEPDAPAPAPATRRAP